MRIHSFATRRALAVSAAVLGGLLAVRSQAAVITEWTFNSTVPDATTSTGSNTPAIGTGTLTLLGGVTSTFAAGSPEETSSPGDNSGLNTTGYPAQGTASGTAGVEFATSTVGSGGPLSISLDFRESGTASRYYQLLVSSDGTTFTAPSGGTASIGNALSPNTSTSFSNTGLFSTNAGSGSQSFVEGVQYTFALGSAYENDPNFAFEFVSVFDPTGAGTSYTGSNSTYAATGTARFDAVTVSVPEPTTIGLIGIGALGLLARRRKA